MFYYYVLSNQFIQMRSDKSLTNNFFDRFLAFWLAAECQLPFSFPCQKGRIMIILYWYALITYTELCLMPEFQEYVTVAIESAVFFIRISVELLTFSFFLPIAQRNFPKITKNETFIFELKFHKAKRFIKQIWLRNWRLKFWSVQNPDSRSDHNHGTN